MSNQEPQNPNPSTEDVAVEKRRRFIKGAGAAVPVILTLTSPSVLGGALCLSQQMSGNASGTPTGQCVLGNSPKTWLNTPTLWTSTPYSYGALPAGKTGCINYTGGTSFFSAFGSGSNSALRSFLCSSLTSQQSTFVTALLNSVVVHNYILTKDQVIAMWNGGVDGGSFPPPSGYANTIAGKTAFLKTTWIVT